MNKEDFIKAKINCKTTPGETLKILRKLQELSQSQLSELAGIYSSQSGLRCFQ